jgi:hypothetical protein
MNISTQSLQQLRDAIASLTAALDTVLSAPPPVLPEPCPFMSKAMQYDVVIHPECITPNVPDGYDTVLGFLARHHPDALECFDYTDPATTQRDGWWLSHRCQTACRTMCQRRPCCAYRA